MTPEDVLIWCEEFESNILSVDPQKKMLLTFEAIKACKEALKKQIPQRPLDFGDKAYLCPNCRRNNFYDGTEKLNKTNFCNYCGQALDWSDKNDRA